MQHEDRVGRCGKVGCFARRKEDVCEAEFRLQGPEHLVEAFPTCDEYEFLDGAKSSEDWKEVRVGPEDPTSLFRGVDDISKDFRMEWIRASPMQSREILLPYLSGQMD